MVPLEQKLSSSKWELPFQVILHIVVFLFFTVDTSNYRDSAPNIEAHHIAFFMNYAVAAFIINYILFPKFLYEKRYWQFFVAFSFVILATILIEELVLEKLFFTGPRAEYFGRIIYSLLDVLPVMIILSGFKLAWDIIRKQMQVEELKASVEESELRFLKSQINPHFLFNNLNNLYAHALENSPKTPQIILEMSSVLRYILYECTNEYVPLRNELKQLENFVKLYEMQIEGRGTVNFTTSGTEGTMYKIAPLILMVFVENAFKHSAVNQADNIQITIDLKLIDGQLYFNCVNSFDQQSDESDHKGIGLANVRKRLAYIYPNAHQLNIDPGKDRYTVKLILDLTHGK